MNQMQSMKIRRDSPHHSLAHAQRMQQLRRMELMQKQLYQRKMHQSAKRGGVVLSQIRPGLRDWYGINPAGVDVGRMQMEARLQRDQANFAQMQKFEETRLKFNGQSAKNSTQVTAGHNAQALAEIKRIQSQGLTGQQIMRNEAVIAGDRSAIEARKKQDWCQKLMGAVGALQRLMNSTLFEGAPRGADPPSAADAAMATEIMGNPTIQNAVAHFDPNGRPPLNVAYKQQFSLKIQQLLRECNILQQDRSLSQDARRQVVPVIAGPLAYFPQPPTRQRGRRGNARFQENRRHGGPPGVGPGPRVEWPRAPDFHGGPGGGPPPGPPPPGPGGLPPGIPIGPGPRPAASAEYINGRINHAINYMLREDGAPENQMEMWIATIFPLAQRNVVLEFQGGVPDLEDDADRERFFAAVEHAIDEVYQRVGVQPPENKHDEKQREVKEEPDGDVDMQEAPSHPLPFAEVDEIPQDPSHPLPFAEVEDLPSGANKSNTVSFLLNSIFRGKFERIEPPDPLPGYAWSSGVRMAARNRAFARAEQEVLDLFRRVRGQDYPTLEDIGVPSKRENAAVRAIAKQRIREAIQELVQSYVPEDASGDAFSRLPNLPSSRPAVPAGTQLLENRPELKAPGQSGIPVEAPASMPFQPGAAPQAAEPQIGPGVHEHALPPPSVLPSSGVTPLPPVLPPHPAPSSAPVPSRGAGSFVRSAYSILAKVIEKVTPGQNAAQRTPLFNAALAEATPAILHYFGTKHNKEYLFLAQIPPMPDKNTEDGLEQRRALRDVFKVAVATVMGDETESEPEEGEQKMPERKQQAMEPFELLPEIEDLLDPKASKHLLQATAHLMITDRRYDPAYLIREFKAKKLQPGSAFSSTDANIKHLRQKWLNALEDLLEAKQIYVTIH